VCVCVCVCVCVFLCVSLPDLQVSNKGVSTNFPFFGLNEK